MNLILSGRGIQVDDRLRGYATEKLSRLDRFFDEITDTEVELSHERNPRVANPNRVEVTVKTPRDTLRAHGESDDFRAAIDMAVDKLEVQVRKLKDRLRRHEHRNGGRPDAPPVDDEDEPLADGRLVRMSQHFVKPMAPEDAIIELESRNMGFLMFTNSENMHAAVVFRRPNGSYGLIEHET